MDEDRITGKATELGGKVKDAVGGIAGDTQTQAEGKLDQVTGSLQTAYGSAKDSVRESAGGAADQVIDFVKTKPILALVSAVAVGFALSRLIDRD